MDPMTEEAWLSAGEPFPLLAHIRPQASERKLRLFACACVRQTWHALVDEASQRAVEVAERHADGRATRAELLAVHAEAVEVAALADLRTTASDQSWAATRAAARSSDPDSDLFRVATGAAFLCSISAAPWNFDPLTGVVLDRGDPDSKALARSFQSDLLREIFGNPFRPVSLDPAWLEWDNGVVSRLARSIYDERRFEHLPILADALEEAGCTNPDLLIHCRQRSGHVLGCWALDTVLELS